MDVPDFQSGGFKWVEQRKETDDDDHDEVIRGTKQTEYGAISAAPSPRPKGASNGAFEKALTRNLALSSTMAAYEMRPKGMTTRQWRHGLGVHGPYGHRIKRLSVLAKLITLQSRY
jgi:hypothetical protein